MTDGTGLDLIGVTDIKGDPNNPNILYVASGGGGLGRDFSYSIGIVRTQDAGKTWEIIYGQEPKQLTSVNYLLIDPTNTNILYAGVRDTLFRFTNNGSYWSKFVVAVMPKDAGWPNAEFRWIRDIEMKPGSPDTLYVATDNKNWTNHYAAQIWRVTGVRSSNPTMQRLDQLLPSDGPVHTERFELAVTPQYPNWIYAQAKHVKMNDTSYYAIWRSKDKGLTWEKKYEEKSPTGYGQSFIGCGNVDYYKNELLLNLTDTSVLYVGGNSMTRVVNWQNDETTDYNTETYHADTRSAMLVRSSLGGTSDMIFAGNDGGLSKTTDGIDSWVNLNGDGLTITQFYSIGSTEVANTRVCGGTIDNCFFSFDGTTWTNSGEETSRTVVDFQSPNFVYTNPFSPSYDNSYPTARSNNFGITWLTPHLISTPNQNGHFNRPLVLNPINPKSLYCGAYDIFKTFSAQSLQDYSVLKIPVHLNGSYAEIDSTEKLINITISPVDTTIMYIAYDGPHWWAPKRMHKLLKTSDEGQSFVDLLALTGNSALQSVLSSVGISDICLSPVDIDNVWISISGFDKFSSSPTAVQNKFSPL